MASGTVAFDAMPAEWKAVYFAGMFVIVLGIVVALLLYERGKKE